MMPPNEDRWVSLFIKTVRDSVNKFIMDSAPGTAHSYHFCPL